MSNLVDKFKKAGLKLKLLDNPIQNGRGMSEIVQIDIGRKVKGTRREEWFEIYPGHEDNRIEVLNVDKKSCQLTLLVKEPEREFEVEDRKFARNASATRDRLKRDKVKFRETKTHFIITEKTVADTRHFLMGVDERQLFIAQLRDRVTTVADARRSLGNSIRLFEGKRKMTPGRQGEWFFVRATPTQEEMIEDMVKSNRTVIQHKKNIGEIHTTRNNGNPHTADEIVVVSVGKTPESNFPVRDRQVFVRGCIRHIDHKTIKYSYWHEVIANNEGATGNGGSSGITWID